jgi:predicted ester cyclase
MSQENIAASKRLIEEGFNRGNVDVIDELCADGFVDHDPLMGDQDVAAAKQTMAGYREAFPDIHITIEDIFDAGDKVVYRWTGEGTFENEMMGLEPTHESGDPVRGVTIDRFEGDKVVESWTHFDTLTLMRNVGAVSEQAGAPSGS